MRLCTLTVLGWALLGMVASANAQIALKGNRYVCYVVERLGGGSQIPDLKVKDQFGIAGMTVLKPRYVCNPAELNGTPRADPRSHLVCYEAQTPIKPRPVTINTLFENVPRVELGAAQLVCVPSLKKLAK